MGKQLGYYATPLDEAAIVEEAVHRLGGVFIRSTFQHPEDMAVPTLPVIDSVPPKHLLFLLYSPAISDPLVIRSYPTGVYTVHQADSLVVEVERSRILGSICFIGRLWYEQVRDDGTRKPDAFISWAEGLFTWVATHFMLQQDGPRSYYVGPDAAKRVQRGDLRLA